ncbi:quercetin dioxygenase-like cupin family protein [Rhizobium sp. BK313]|jgi:quercetin dioxygenase-like cupin family protein|uniref:cupin domain-containing protein n=1 Tax=Rhizobium sp. BK313 TaxID=2587081 RepID=UPI00105F4FAD|nr:cupin domain-containing protein [Rhizobium sp. BK313]MBB3454768.1 quercetin dioxygenase-like cupin family protein [Rhizobium sp. BK313]
MKIAQTLLIGTAVLGVSLFMAPAQAAEDHVLVLPDKVQWGPAPPVLPAGAKAAVLYGDPAKEGQFALRLKLPRGYHVPPHTHPVDENVTVISGRFQLGMGEAADKSKAKALPAGSFFSLPPGMVHYVYTDEETVIQINTVGPWGLKYVNPKDDPRKKM